MTQEMKAARSRPDAGLSPEHPGHRFIIENLFPAVDGGRYPVKRIAGDPVHVWVDIFRDGHDVARASLRWRLIGSRRWETAPLIHFGNDRWTGQFTPDAPGRYEFAIEAWTDAFATWRRDFLLKREAGLDVGLEAREGRDLLLRTKAAGAAASHLLAKAIEQFNLSGNPDALLSDALAEAMTHIEPRADLSWSRAFPLTIDRPRARASAWYEIFPRGQSPEAGRHGTFDDCIARLPDIAAMGFDVLYFPPIHPIGRKNRKGRNNSLTAGPDDPGSPYAIGGEAGGHDQVHPELGTLADFRRLVHAAEKHGLEIALDFAIQCSPDHPWLREHPDWFKWRPDGSMRYAENPPKKYEDIVNPEFYCDDRTGLWDALRDIVLFWVDQGVRIFRVDNPHTKPFPFWEWMIAEVQAHAPDTIFLSEAFTRPKPMKALAKLGFTQSYTYFTWRTGKDEFSEYLSELTGYPEREFYRPNFFVNTPDILPYHLQGGERWMFRSRLALAATLSSNYGVYNGFELLEHIPVSGKEEYLDSEKYELKARDWHAPGNIREDITRINRIRRENPALQQTADLRFVAVDSPHVIGFVKQSFTQDNAVAVAIALAQGSHDVWLHFGDMQIGPPDARSHVRAVENLVTGERRMLEWGGLRLHIDTDQDPVILFRCLA